MPIAIRPGHLEHDRDLAIRMFARYLNPRYDRRRFDWVYRQNPYGLGRLWIATDSNSGATVGTAGAFPRRIYLAGCEEVAWALGDFCVSDQYRSLGPALQLQRLCLAEVDSGAAALCYDFPSTGFMAVYRRLNIAPNGHMIRLAKALRVDRKLEKINIIPWVTRGLGAAANLLLAFRDRASRDSRTVTVSLYQGHCGPEFSALAQEIVDRYGACIQRSAAYLNWRYMDNPLYPCELLTARRDGALLAYAVFTCIGKDATLMDLFGHCDPHVLRTLINGLVSLLRARGIITVSAPILASHPWIAILQGLGFRPRESTPVVLYPISRIRSTVDPRTLRPWLFVYGDRDS